MGFAVPTDFSQTNTSFEPIPADNHVGICIGVIDLGTHQESYQGKPPKAVRKVKLQFELPNVDRTDGKKAIISATYNYFMNDKATFRKLLDGWLGNDWTERSKGKSWDFLIGTPAMVNVESGPSKRDATRVVTWVESVSKYPKGLPAPAMTRERFYLDLTEKSLPETLSPWDAETVRKSAEYLAGGFSDRAPRPGDAGPRGPAANTAAAGLKGDPRPGAPKPPADVAPLLAKYNLSWPLHVEDIPDQVDDSDLEVLSSVAIAF